jgi:geranylgeranyl diphosphate synthase type II
MGLASRVETALSTHFERALGQGGPTGLEKAMRHAVFSGGARVRPQLCIAVSMACGDAHPELTDAAAVAIELMHCASLVHDDMPAFDNADQRRGQPSVHKAFGEPLALLCGDALIVMAYQVVLHACATQPQHLHAVLHNLSQSVGLPNGIVAGQAWECESRADLQTYQRAKTGALFVASVRAGALVNGQDPQPWSALGEYLGQAYQAADDIRDVLGQADVLGKPVGQDALLGRPSVMQELGLDGALAYFDGLMHSAVEAVPACTCREMLQHLVRLESKRLIPSGIVRSAHSEALSDAATGKAQHVNG